MDKYRPFLARNSVNHRGKNIFGGATYPQDNDGEGLPLRFKVARNRFEMRQHGAPRS